MLKGRRFRRLFNETILRQGIRSCRAVRTFSDSGDESQHPIRRTLRILRNDMTKVKNFFLPSSPTHMVGHEGVKRNDVDCPGVLEKDYSGPQENNVFQTHCDVLVVGGGMTGASVAYWLKQKARQALNVVVVERDVTYAHASTAMPAGGLRQQYSLPEHIQMSLFGAEFIRDAKANLDINLNYTPHGCLVLAAEDGAEALKRNSHLQNEFGARNELLTTNRLKRKFPWLNTENIVLGCHGLEKEGWFDPWALLMGFKQKATEFGTHFVNAELIRFEFQNQPDMVIEDVVADDAPTYEAIDKAVVQMPNGEERTIKFALCVLAAGLQSGKVARLARIGAGSGILRVPLPVEPQRRYAYAFNTEDRNAPGLCSPFTVNTDGTHFRSDGLTGNYVSSHIIAESTKNSNSLREYFEKEVQPTLARRVKAFDSAKLCRSWEGYSAYNIFDGNGIIGPHAYYNNLYIATGFSGRGIQLAPAVGRAISELIIDGQFRTIDLSRFGFDRIIVDRPIFETSVLSN